MDQSERAIYEKEFVQHAFGLDNVHTKTKKSKKVKASGNSRLRLQEQQKPDR
jgi:hypothetical protein